MLHAALALDLQPQTEQLLVGDAGRFVHGDQHRRVGGGDQKAGDPGLTAQDHVILAAGRGPGEVPSGGEERRGGSPVVEQAPNGVQPLTDEDRARLVAHDPATSPAPTAGSTGWKPAARPNLASYSRSMRFRSSSTA